MAEGGPSGSGEASMIIEDDEANINLDKEPVGVINRWEAQHHKHLIEDALRDFKCCNEGSVIKHVMKQLIEEFKFIITCVYPAMEEADIVIMLHAILDCTCLAMRPQTSEVEGMLEDIMPEEDIPISEKMAAEASNIWPLTYDQKDMIVSLFNDISVAYEHLARAAGMMSSLYNVLNPQQLMLIMQNAMCPLIQLNALPGLFDPPSKKEREELPDDHTEWVHDMIIPNLKEKMFMKEMHYNSTCLLAATLAFYVDRSFGKTCTMKEVKEKFIVRMKQLSLCITGRKYIGGSERKAQLNHKRKSVPAETAKKNPEDDDDNNNLPPPPAKEGRSAVKEWPN